MANTILLADGRRRAAGAMMTSTVLGGNRMSRSLMLLAAGAALSVSGQAFAQAATPQAAADETEQAPDIIVTGSQIARSGFDTPTPVTVVSTADFERVGAPNIADALNQLPALKPSVTPEATTNLSKLSGGNYLDLRGLTYLRTLTLVDGKRPTPSSPEGVVNINNIPQSVIAGAEVVTGGASAAYGSDAVAGVVNFKVDHKLQGVRGSAQYGISDYGDNKSYLASFAAGTRFGDDRGHIIVGGEYAGSKGIPNYGSRGAWGDYGDISNPASTTTNGEPTFILVNQPRSSIASYGGVINSATGTNGTALLRGIQFGAGGSTSAFNYGTLQTANSHSGGDGVCGICDAVLKQPYVRWSAIASGEFEFSEAATLYGTASYARSEVKNGPSITGNDQITIQRDNVYIPASVRTILNANPTITNFVMGRALNDYARGYINKKATNWQGIIGLRGKIGGSWSYDAAYAFGKGRDYSDFAGARITANWQKAVDAVDDPRTVAVDPICRSTLTDPTNGCVPLNLFGVVAPGQQAAAIDYITGSSIRDWHMKQQTADLIVRGNLFSLPAGEVAMAAGVHWRKFEVNVLSDPLSASRPGGATVYRVGNTIPFAGAEEVKEAFGEILIPIFRDQSFAKSLELDLAGRITDYKTSGQVETWKVGVNYTINDVVRLRATRSRDIRAPNIQELFAQGQTLIYGITDTARGENYSVSGTSAGNKFLTPEIANSFTGGLVLSPMRGLQISLDYYDIKIGGAVAALSAQQIVTRCNTGDAGACLLITRDPSAGGQPGRVNGVLLAPVNFQSIKTEGLDVEARYRTNFWNGNLELRLLGNYVNKLTLIGDGGVATEMAGSLGQTFIDGINGSPHLRVTSSVSYDTDDYRLNLTGRYVGGGIITRDKVVATKPASTPLIDKLYANGRVYLDLSGEVTLFKPIGSNSKVALFGTVLNLLNTDPPITGYDWATARHLYDVIGRQFIGGVRFNF
jgi:iron complex outermembrane receptor protein